jgi:hypothetical protein
MLHSTQHLSYKSFHTHAHKKSFLEKSLFPRSPDPLVGNGMGCFILSPLYSVTPSSSFPETWLGGLPFITC